LVFIADAVKDLFDQSTPFIDCFVLALEYESITHHSKLFYAILKETFKENNVFFHLNCKQGVFFPLEHGEKHG